MPLLVVSCQYIWVVAGVYLPGRIPVALVSYRYIGSVNGIYSVSIHLASCRYIYPVTGPLCGVIYLGHARPSHARYLSVHLVSHRYLWSSIATSGQ